MRADVRVLSLSLVAAIFLACDEGRTTNTKAGQVLHQAIYLPCGKPLSEIGAQAAKPNYTFTGYEQDDALLLLDAGARMLNSTTCRFTGIDPKDQPSMSAYTYAANNPMKFTDPDGKQFTALQQDGKKKSNSGSTESAQSLQTTQKPRPVETATPPGNPYPTVRRIANVDPSQNDVPSLSANTSFESGGFFKSYLRMVGNVPVALGLTDRNLHYDQGVDITTLYTVEQLEAAGFSPRVNALADTGFLVAILALGPPVLAYGGLELMLSVGVPLTAASEITFFVELGSIAHYFETQETEKSTQVKERKP